MLRATDGGKHLNKWVAIQSSLSIAAFGTVLSADAAAGIQFKSYQTHSHIVVSVDPDVTYSVEPVVSAGKVTALKLILSGVKDDLGDLGSVQDPRTEKVMLTRLKSTMEGQDAEKRVIYQFILSSKAKSGGIEFFDYRNKTPSEIALDYWLKAPASESVAKKADAGSGKPKLLGKASPRKKTHVGTTAFEGCGRTLDLAAEGMANFRVYHKAYDYRKFFGLWPADQGYAYPAEKTGDKPPRQLKVDEKELAHYRLAFKLYRESKYALALRTLEFFKAKFPKSALAPELVFLRANIFVQLSKLLRTNRYLDQAMDVFRRIVLDEAGTERAKNSLAFVIAQTMERGTPVLVLEYAMIGAEQKPEEFRDPQTPAIYRLASAEALYALGEHDRAESAYQRIMDLGSELSPEAAFRIGEVMSARKYWERGVIYYEKAIRQFPKEADRFPTAFFNLAEAYFRLGRYGDAERVYRDYDGRFPTDDASWAARLRLAELEQLKLKEADPRKHDLILGFYESVVNRHPYSAGAMMAELRLAKCYKGLPQNDRTRAFYDNFFGTRDLKKFDDKLVDAAEAEQWMDLTEAAFYLNNGEPRLALKRADEYRPKLGKSSLADSFRKIYSKAAVDLVESLAHAEDGESKKHASELLAVAEHYADFAPTPQPLGYVMALTKAYMAIENMPSATQALTSIESRMADATDGQKDEYHLLKALQLRMLGERSERVISELTQIRDTGELSAIKFDELAQTYFDKRDYRAAISYDNRLLDGVLGSRLNIERRLAATIRRVEANTQLKQFVDAVRLADHAMLKFGTETDLSTALARLKDLRAQALFDSGDHKRAVEAFDEILGVAPNHPRHQEFEFMRGKALAQLGRENEAIETFKKLANAPANDVWRKSAQAELDQLQWESKTLNQIKDRRSSQ